MRRAEGNASNPTNNITFVAQLVILRQLQLERSVQFDIITCQKDCEAEGGRVTYIIFSFVFSFSYFLVSDGYLLILMLQTYG